MSTVSAPDLVLLRKAAHRETLNLNVFKPDTILAARVNNGAIIRGARSIAYDGGSGTFALIRSYQVLWVGTAPGLYDVGRVRIKSIAGTAITGTITVDENAIPWTDDQYLTIKFDYPITNIQPRISGGIFYKHYNTAFPGINQVALPVCIAGPDRVEPLPDAVTTTTSFSIAASGDDGYISAVGGFTPAGADVRFDRLLGAIYTQAWLRFQNVTIPAGVTVTSATITFQPSSLAVGTITFTVFAEDADDAAAPVSTVDYNGKTTTTASESWTISAASGAVTTPDLSSVVQEVIDRAGWASGQALQFLIKNGTAASETFKRFISYDASPANAPVLTVTYVTNPTVTFNFDLTDSYAIADGATIASYNLTAAPSATATVVNTGAGTYTVTVSTEDSWWVTASVTDSNSQSQERFVLVTTEPPYRDFELTNWTETWGQGIRCSVNVHGDVTLSDFPDGALCLLWYDGAFNGTEDYVNILASDYDNLLTVGTIRNENSADQQGSHEVTFQITTIDDLLNNVPMMSISIEAVATPATWYEYARWLTVGRAIHHLLLWHSDVIHRVDYIGGTVNTLRLKEAKFEEGTLFQQANRLAFDQGILARLTCDRLNRLHLVEDSQMLNTAGRAALDIVFDIEESDLSGDVAYVRNVEERVYISQLSGFYFDGANSTAYVSLIPGYQEASVSYSLPEQRGASSQNRTQQVLASQTDSNEKAGRVHAETNRPIQEFRLSFRGNYIGALTTVPSFGWYRMGLDNTDLGRELDINNVKLLCRQINLQYRQGHFTVNGVFEPEAEGPDGIPGNYPTTMPSTPVVQPRWEAEAIDALLAFSSASFRDDGDTDWEELQTGSYNHGCIDPWWQVKQRTTDPEKLIWWAAADGKLYRVRGKNGTPDERTPVSNPPNTWSDGTAPTVADLEFIQITGDMWRESTFYALARWQEAGGDWRGWLLVTDDDGLTWSYVALYDGLDLPTQIKPIWTAVNGTYVLVTIWEDDTADTLVLLQFDTVTLAYSAEDSLGAVTLAELNDRTYYAFPVTVLDDDDLWHVAGRMNAPAGVAGTQHIIKTTNAGTAFSSVDALHTTKHVAALAVGLDSGGDRVYHLIVQAVTAGVPDLSAGTETVMQDDVGTTNWQVYMARLSDTEMYVFVSGSSENATRTLYTVGAGFGAPTTLTVVAELIVREYPVASNQVPAGRSALFRDIATTSVYINLPNSASSVQLYDLEDSLQGGAHLTSPVFALVGSQADVSRDITVVDDYTTGAPGYTTYNNILPVDFALRGVHSNLNNRLICVGDTGSLVACLVTFDGSFIPTLASQDTLAETAAFIPDFIQISDTEYWVFYRSSIVNDDYSLYMVDVTISGTTISWGTPVLIYTLASGNGISRPPIEFIKLNDTRAVFYYQEERYSGGDYYDSLRVVTIELGVGMDNNAIVLDTQDNSYNNEDPLTYGRTIGKLSDSKLLASWYSDDAERIFREVDIS